MRFISEFLLKRAEKQFDKAEEAYQKARQRIIDEDPELGLSPIKGIAQGFIVMKQDAQKVYERYVAQRTQEAVTEEEQKVLNGELVHIGRSIAEGMADIQGTIDVIDRAAESQQRARNIKIDGLLFCTTEHGRHNKALAWKNLMQTFYNYWHPVN